MSSLSNILKTMYGTAPEKQKVVSIHLFGIRYAAELQAQGSIKETVIAAGLPESYATEVQKGMNLAEFVEVKGG